MTQICANEVSGRERSRYLSALAFTLINTCFLRSVVYPAVILYLYVTESIALTKNQGPDYRVFCCRIHHFSGEEVQEAEFPSEKDSTPDVSFDEGDKKTDLR